MQLEARLVEKPWGRTDIPPMFKSTGGRRIGEIWFDAVEPLPLLAKYIFTSERLSIQVHPDDAQARARGLASGKTECWAILAAEAGATLALGPKRETTAEELRAAALDGSIEQLMDWRPVSAGDFLYVPAGTVHAIGAGIVLLEFQQNRGSTFRLYDYGRPRELHLDEAIAVADPRPYPPGHARRIDPDRPAVLVDGPHFCLVHAAGGAGPGDELRGRRRWVMPLDGEVASRGETAVPGQCLLVEGEAELDLAGARALIGAEGPL